MKSLFNYAVVLSIVSLIGFGIKSCKKEVSLRLVVTAVDTVKTRLAGAEVWIYHGNPPPPNIQSHDDDNCNVKKTTESNGTASFDVPN